MNDAESIAQVKRLHGTTDGSVWAKEFNDVLAKQYSLRVDEGWLIGWFANAIEIGRAAGKNAKAPSSLACTDSPEAVFGLPISEARIYHILGERFQAESEAFRRARKAVWVILHEISRAGVPSVAARDQIKLLADAEENAKLLLHFRIEPEVGGIRWNGRALDQTMVDAAHSTLNLIEAIKSAASPAAPVGAHPIADNATDTEKAAAFEWLRGLATREDIQPETQRHAGIVLDEWHALKSASTPAATAMPDSPRRWRVKDEQGDDLIAVWKRRPRSADEYAAAEIIEELEYDLSAAKAQIALDTGNIERIRGAGEKAERELAEAYRLAVNPAAALAKLERSAATPPAIAHPNNRGDQADPETGGSSPGDPRPINDAAPQVPAQGENRGPAGSDVRRAEGQPEPAAAASPSLTPTDGSRLRDKAPMPPEVLVSALQDPLPIEKGETRPAHASRSIREEHKAWKADAPPYTPPTTGRADLSAALKSAGELRDLFSILRTYGDYNELHRAADTLVEQGVEIRRLQERCKELTPSLPARSEIPAKDLFEVLDWLKDEEGGMHNIANVTGDKRAERAAKNIPLAAELLRAFMFGSTLPSAIGRKEPDDA